MSDGLVDAVRRTVLLSLLGGAAASCAPAPKRRLIDVRNTYPALDFQMEDAGAGKQVTARDFRGQVVVLFFGYTFCPDVCPTTMATLTSTMAALKGVSQGVTLLFVTVDPARDTPQVLKDYVESFSPRTRGLRGTPNELASLARRYRVAYAVAAGSSPDNYLMNHTATVFIFDQKGRIQLLAPYGTGASDFEHDLRLLSKAPARA